MLNEAFRLCVCPKLYSSRVHFILSQAPKFCPHGAQGRSNETCHAYEIYGGPKAMSLVSPHVHAYTQAVATGLLPRIVVKSWVLIGW